MASIQEELASFAVSPMDRPTQMPGQHQQQIQEGGTQHLERVRAVYGGASLNDTAASHVRCDTDSEDMAVSGEAPVEVFSVINQGTPEVVQSNFGSVFERVSWPLTESVVRVGGHGIRFDQNRSTVTPPPRLLTLDQPQYSAPNPPSPASPCPSHHTLSRPSPNITTNSLSWNDKNYTQNMTATSSTSAMSITSSSSSNHIMLKICHDHAK
jgi:hypothetical protein